MGSERERASFGDPKVFAVEMSRLLNSQEFGDIKFIVGEEKRVFFGHRCVLGTRCEVFRAMFADQAAKGDTSLDPYILSDVQPTVFHTLLEFVYTNRCTLSLDTVVDVMAISIEYGLADLTRVCVEFIRDTLSVDNVCEATQAALTYQQDHLADKCLAVIEENTEAVFKTRGFTELSDDTLSYILGSDNLMADEGEILKAVKEWATVNSVVSGESMGEVCKNTIEHIRFPLIDPEELAFIDKENERKQYIPISLIKNAWKFHATKEVDPSRKQTRPRAGTLPKESLKVLGLGART